MELHGDSVAFASAWEGGAIGKQLAGERHIIKLQEAAEYLEFQFLTTRFHVTHYGGAILFNMDAFLSDIKVMSIYLHNLRDYQQEKVKEGTSGWVLHGVISRASFRRQPRSGKILHVYVSSHQQQYARLR